MITLDPMGKTTRQFNNLHKGLRDGTGTGDVPQKMREAYEKSLVDAFGNPRDPMITYDENGISIGAKGNIGPDDSGLLGEKKGAGSVPTLPDIAYLKTLSDEDLLKIVTPQMINWKVSFNRKYEEDAAINGLLEYLKQNNTRDFPANIAKSTYADYRLGHKFVPGRPLGNVGNTEGSVDEKKSIDTYIRKTDDDTYICTGMFIYNILAMYENA